MKAAALSTPNASAIATADRLTRHSTTANARWTRYVRVFDTMKSRSSEIRPSTGFSSSRSKNPAVELGGGQTRYRPISRTIITTAAKAHHAPVTRSPRHWSASRRTIAVSTSVNVASTSPYLVSCFDASSTNGWHIEHKVPAPPDVRLLPRPVGRQATERRMSEAP